MKPCGFREEGQCLTLGGSKASLMRWQQRDDRKERPFNSEMKGHHPGRRVSRLGQPPPHAQLGPPPPPAQKAPIKSINWRQGTGGTRPGPWSQWGAALFFEEGLQGEPASSWGKWREPGLAQGLA